MYEKLLAANNIAIPESIKPKPGIRGSVVPNNK